MISRNEAMGIVERTHKNLVYMRAARKEGADIHEVTHLFNSLLGLIVIPWERELKGVDVLDLSMEHIYDQGWPNICLLLDEYSVQTKTLKVLVRHLRNAIAHGRFRFEGIGSSSADSRESSEIKVIVEDEMTIKKGDTRRWKAEIRGEDLYQFCDKFMQHIRDRVG